MATSSTERFFGAVVLVFGTVLSAIVVAYWLWIVWYGATFDFSSTPVVGRAVPVETYPIILLTMWIGVEIAKNRIRPTGDVAWWIDFGTAAIVFAFLIATLIKMYVSRTNWSFIIPLSSFCFLSTIDLLMMSKSLYDAGETGGLVGAGSTRGGQFVGGNNQQQYNFWIPKGSSVDFDLTGDVPKMHVQPTNPQT